MCGRFHLTVLEEGIRIRYQVDVYEEIYKPRYNCAPTQNLAVITNREPQKLNFFKWGLIPFWAKDIRIGNKLINARAETILEKPSFKAFFKSKRCLVPADGFYEWKKSGKTKIPFRITLCDNQLFSFAGLWDNWKDENGLLINSFTIITTSPNELISGIHNRMPVILPPQMEQAWLHEENTALLQSFLTPFPSEMMKVHEVSSRVNSPLIDNRDLIENQ